jgi:hypothetical protein
MASFFILFHRLSKRAIVNSTIFPILSYFRYVKCCSKLLNVVVECSTPLLRIWEVSDANLGPESGYPD